MGDNLNKKVDYGFSFLKCCKASAEDELRIRFYNEYINLPGNWDIYKNNIREFWNKSFSYVEAKMRAHKYHLS